MPVSFPHPPDDASGDWAVTLPDQAGIGQLLVYGTPATPPITPIPAYLRWKCDESALPLLEASGFDHTLTAMTSGAWNFGQASMRADATGHSLGNASSTDAEGEWGPPLSRVGTDFTLAALLGPDVSTAGVSVAYVYMAGIMALRFQHAFSGNIGMFWYLWDGTAYVEAWDTGLTTTIPPGGAFTALRVSAGGAWTAWWGDNVYATGTTSAWSPSPTWAIRAIQNDANACLIQEIHAWPGVATDFDVESVRFDLVGV